jgi:hypothetical protein
VTSNSAAGKDADPSNMVATLKIIKKLNQKIVRAMQRIILTENFYNFRNNFFYNFERSDPKLCGGESRNSEQQ